MKKRKKSQNTWDFITKKVGFKVLATCFHNLHTPPASEAIRAASTSHTNRRHPWAGLHLLAIDFRGWKGSYCAVCSSLPKAAACLSQSQPPSLDHKEFDNLTSASQIDKGNVLFASTLLSFCLQEASYVAAVEDALAIGFIINSHNNT